MQESAKIGGPKPAMPGRVNDLDVGFEDEGQSAMEGWQFCRIRPDTRGGIARCPWLMSVPYRVNPFDIRHAVAIQAAVENLRRMS